MGEVQVGLGVARWGQVGRDGARWGLVGTSRGRWGQVGAGGGRWGQGVEGRRWRARYSPAGVVHHKSSI